MATQKQQGIKKRLTKGFTKVAVIGAVAAIIGIGALLIAAAQYEKALNRYGFTQGDIGKAMTAFSESRSALRAVVGYDDEAVIEKQTALHDQKKEAFETYMDELSRTLKFSEGREAYNAVLTELDGYWELDARILELATSDDADGYLEAQELSVSASGVEFRMFLGGLTSKEKSALKKGSAEFGLHVTGDGDIFFLYRFDTYTIPWSDAPYTALLVKPENRSLPPLWKTTRSGTA